MKSKIRCDWVYAFFACAGLVHGNALAATVNEIQKLIASDGAAFDEFGLPVAVDGDTAVIGARLRDEGGFDSGAAYVFIRGNDGTWTEQQKLTASDGAANDFFGMRVAIDGDTIVIGAEADDDDGASSGAAYVYTRSAGVWSEQQKLTASDAEAGDWFGSAVAVDGDTAIIGAERDDDNGSNSGSAYVFTRTAGVWSEQQKLTAGNGEAFDDFGSAIAMDGNTAVIGARFGDVGNLFVEQDFGTAYVFVNNGGVWTEQQMLMASDGAKEDQFGISVAVSGDTVVVGAHLDADNGADSGSAYAFTRSAGVWTEEQKLTSSDGGAGHEFGTWVGVSGNTAVIGTWLDDSIGSEAGSAYLYTRSSGSWTEEDKLEASDVAAFDHFGQAVAINGETILIGSTRDDDNGGASGSAYIFAAPAGPGVLLDLAALADIDGNTFADMAVLVADSQASNVYVRDGSTGSAISEIAVLNSSWQPVDIAATPASGASARIGVLAQRDTGAIKVAVYRADNGTLVQEIGFFNQNWTPVGLLYVPDAAGPGGSAFAVLARNKNDNRISVQVRRRSDGSLVGTILYFQSIWEALDFEMLADVSGNSRPEIAVLAQSDVGQIVALVRDASNGDFVNRIAFLGRSSTPVAMTVLDSVGGGAAPDLAVLGSKPTGRNIVQTRDSLTDALVNNIFFYNLNWATVDVGGLEDINGNSSADLTVLAQHDSNGRSQADVRDGANGALIQTMRFLGAAFDVHALAIFADISGNTIQELGAVGSNAEGEVRVQLRDASTGLVVSTITIP